MLFRSVATVSLFMAMPAVADSCCFPGGDCEQLLEEQCDAQGGTFVPGEDCFSGACEPVGACCYQQDGVCEVVTEEECYGSLGTNIWYGPGASCADVTCIAAIGACCFDDGTCWSDAWEDDCWSSGGTYEGTGSLCGEVDCCPSCDVFGACCITSTGACDILTEEECYINEGSNTWFGPDSMCEDVTCVAAVGACCLEEGGCMSDVWEDDCWSMGGSYVGTGSSCEKADCCPWDLDGDGANDFADLLILLSEWGACSGCAADLDFSGDVGLTDLVIFLANWGSC